MTEQGSELYGHKPQAHLNGVIPETSVSGNPVEKHQFGGLDHQLPLGSETIKLLAQIRAEQHPVTGRVGRLGKPAKRNLGSNW